MRTHRTGNIVYGPSVRWHEFCLPTCSQLCGNLPLSGVTGAGGLVYAVCSSCQPPQPPARIWTPPENRCTECLVAWLRINSWRYYNDEADTTDAEYDRAFRELEKRESGVDRPEIDGDFWSAWTAAKIKEESPTHLVQVQERPEWPVICPRNCTS